MLDGVVESEPIGFEVERNLAAVMTWRDTACRSSPRGPQTGEALANEAGVILGEIEQHFAGFADWTLIDTRHGGANKRGPDRGRAKSCRVTGCRRQRPTAARFQSGSTSQGTVMSGSWSSPRRQIARGSTFMISGDQDIFDGSFEDVSSTKLWSRS